MSFYRIYRYPYKGTEKCDRHVLIFRGRILKAVNRARKSERKDDVRMSESLSRTKKVVKELAFCNKFDYFCTFTISQDSGVNRYDLAGCRKRLAKLFNNYRNRYSKDFRYVLIPEFHKDGAVHFHGLVAGIRPEDLKKPDFVPCRDVFSRELKMIPNVHGYLDWPYYSEKLGYFSCSPIVNQLAVSNYIVKYITKELLKMPVNQQLYMASKGLKRAELVFDCDDFPMVGKDDFHNDFCRIQWHGWDFLENDMGIIDALQDAQVSEDAPEVWEQMKL